MYVYTYSIASACVTVRAKDDLVQVWVWISQSRAPKTLLSCRGFWLNHQSYSVYTYLHMVCEKKKKRITTNRNLHIIYFTDSFDSMYMCFSCLEKEERYVCTYLNSCSVHTLSNTHPRINTTLTLGKYSAHNLMPTSLASQAFAF